ncbi:hypothetical protein [Photobacterium kishitanii]|uniref:hypothetical protein n=1 Tax=Photobacterium kishitanii TaxID=318456 RepID=UPI002739CBDA|nr:hypothetical protein [Photobacterium kishitanii]
MKVLANLILRFAGLNGSYIVKDCQGTFSYYSNRSHNMARVPANLITALMTANFQCIEYLMVMGRVINNG